MSSKVRLRRRKQLNAALMAVLSSDSSYSGGVGLPVAELLEMIAGYVGISRPDVSTVTVVLPERNYWYRPSAAVYWESSDPAFNPSLIALDPSESIIHRIDLKTSSFTPPPHHHHTT